MKIVSICCDLYADIAPAWLHLWRAGWPDCPHEIVFLTNSLPLAVDAPVVYVEGQDINLGWRLRTFIKEHYADEHLLLTMADYLPKSFDTDLIATAHELCATPEIRHVRLRPMPRPSEDYPVDGLGLINKRARYAMSLQPGIWETGVLYDLLDDKWDPWQCEVLGSLRVQITSGLFLSVDRLAMPFVHYYRKGQPDGINWVHDNVPSAAWPDAVRKEYGDE